MLLARFRISYIFDFYGYGYGSCFTSTSAAFSLSVCGGASTGVYVLGCATGVLVYFVAVYVAVCVSPVGVVSVGVAVVFWVFCMVSVVVAAGGVVFYYFVFADD